MTNIIVVFPKQEDARNIRSLLMRNGYSVAAVCTSGTAALQAADSLNEGIVVCGYRYRDMLYDQLYENLPPTFRMLLLASERVLNEGIPDGIAIVCMPLKVQVFLESLEDVLFSMDQIRNRGFPPHWHFPEDNQRIPRKSYYPVFSARYRARLHRRTPYIPLLSARLG